MKAEVVIGLEVHLQLRTESKIFCPCSAGYNLDSNRQVCPLCAGFPGVLPVLNEKAKRYALITALGLGCRINEFSLFARKQYFYPDLPKNYQISQYDLPLAEKGALEIEIEGGRKKIGITRVHLEEDAGKLLHYIGAKALDHSLVDLNRSGMPLLEIVSEPEINSSAEAFGYLQELKSLLQFIGVSDCNMEEGSLRCDANISIKKEGSCKLGVKTELKNMNSFRAVKKALDYEIKRQKELLSQGKEIIQETRLWDESEEITTSMRRKEEAHDYRYFPEPDLLPVVVSKKEIEELRKILPESPSQMRARFREKYQLSEYDIALLTAEKDLAASYEEAMNYWARSKKLTREDYKNGANWYTGPIKEKLNEKKINFSSSPLTSQYVAELLKLIDKEEINRRQAKEFLKKAMEKKSGKASLSDSSQMERQISDEGEIRKQTGLVLAENKEVVERFHKGEEKLLGYLVGQVMKKTQGRASPRVVNKILKEELKG